MKNEKFDPLATIKEILVVIFAVAVVFGWMMLVQLIISFVALSYITLKLKTMIIVSSIVAAAFGILFETERIRKRKNYAKKLQ